MKRGFFPERSMMLKELMMGKFKLNADVKSSIMNNPVFKDMKKLERKPAPPGKVMASNPNYPLNLFL